MSTPTQQQREVFQISWWAGMGATTTPAPGQTLEQAVYPKLKEALADAPVGSPLHGTPWNLVWGPYILQSDTSHLALNLMYAAQSQADPRRIVIAVAGTNPRSVFDWLVEDGLVGVQVPWLYALGGGPARRISLGTAVGLTILQQGRPGDGIPGAGTTIREFLKELDKQDGPQVVVTGHSLGGALSPTLGLWLHDVRPLWDPFHKVALSTQPSAGPTAGNGPFAGYLDAELPVTRFHNQRDVVPHAWHEADLSRIPLLYAPFIVSPGAFAAAGVAMALAFGGDYTQIAASTPAFPEAVKRSRIDPHKSSLDNFLAQVAWQHIYAYADYFGLKDVHSNAVSDALASAGALPSLLVHRAAGEQTAGAAHTGSIPVGGAPVPLPGRHQPALATFVDQVVAELKKAGTPEQANATFPLDGVHITERVPGPA
ncbi:MAG: Lipase family protein [Gemmatimonadetes bacterium]|nr:Lipase family protein [Gemmatimonadota bacterium]